MLIYLPPNGRVEYKLEDVPFSPELYRPLVMARVLANRCKFNGNTPFFYSYAHSALTLYAWVSDPEHKRAALWLYAPYVHLGEPSLFFTPEVEQAFGDACVSTWNTLGEFYGIRFGQEFYELAGNFLNAEEHWMYHPENRGTFWSKALTSMERETCRECYYKLLIRSLDEN